MQYILQNLLDLHRTLIPRTITSLQIVKCIAICVRTNEIRNKLNTKRIFAFDGRLEKKEKFQLII